MKRPYENKHSYDPGRFRFKVTFFNQVSAPDGFGGTTASLQQILTTMAIQEKISDRSQIAVEAGASVLNQDCWYIIRQRDNFTPQKDMVVLCNGATYFIKGIVPVDVPVRYIRLLCVKQDIDITT